MGRGKFHTFTVPGPAGDHRWTFSRTDDNASIHCVYSLSAARIENGTTWFQCLDAVAGTLDPATMAPRPKRWGIRGRDLRLELLPAGALDRIRERLEVVA